MPLVYISLLKGKSKEHIRAISDLPGILTKEERS